MPFLSQFPMGSPIYAITMMLGIVIGAIFWMKQSRSDHRTAFIYLAAIGGAFIGAKIAYLVSEGWLFIDSEHRWMHWLTGKSVTGALLGGWIGVEVSKKLLGYTETTGDRYAVVPPHRPHHRPPGMPSSRLLSGHCDGFGSALNDRPHRHGPLASCSG